jgi:predicted nucleic acid-binding protein
MLPAKTVTRLPEVDGTEGIASGPPIAQRVVLDTNTVLDWLVFGDPAARGVGVAIEQGRMTWLATPRTLAELRAVLSRPLSPRWDPARELALTIDLTPVAVNCAEPAGVSPTLLCRDANDQVFIDLARQHSPALLLTRDRALLALRRRASAFGVEIMTAAAWWQRLDASPAHEKGDPKAA